MPRILEERQPLFFECLTVVVTFIRATFNYLPPLVVNDMLSIMEVRATWASVSKKVEGIAKVVSGTVYNSLKGEGPNDAVTQVMLSAQKLKATIAKHLETINQNDIKPMIVKASVQQHEGQTERLVMRFAKVQATSEGVTYVDKYLAKRETYKFSEEEREFACNFSVVKITTKWGSVAYCKKPHFEVDKHHLEKCGHFTLNNISPLDWL